MQDNRSHRVIRVLRLNRLQNNELKDPKREFRGTAESAHKSLWVYHYK